MLQNSEVQGVIDKIIYKNDDYLIARIEDDNGQKNVFKGNMIGIEKNEEIILKGKWVHHPKFGQQLEVIRWQRPIPKTKDKIISYLSSPFVKGCGEKQAIRIVESLGTNAIEIIMNEKENALVGIRGIGRKKALSIAQSVAATYELQNIIAELSNYGISPNFTVKLYKKFQEETVQIIKENPYQLTDMKFISFPKADEIARRMGISPLSGFRIEACINYVLRDTCYQTGHCYLNEQRLIDLAISLLNQNIDEKDKAYENDIIQSIYALEERTIIIENEIVYPKELYIYETKLAKKVHQMLASKHKKISTKKIETAIKEYQLKHRMELGDEQKQAIKTAINSNITVLTGSAGTGKTTVVKAIIEIYEKFFSKKKLSLSAPTGRASRKLQEATGRFSQTNHRLLGYKQNTDGKQMGFEFNEKNKLPHDFFIIDEMSMVDLHMGYSLFRAMEKNAKVLLIGDVDQLPSIGSGNVLKDLLEQENVPKLYLTQIYRQAKNSQIIVNANHVNKGETFLVDHSKGDMYFINQQQDNGIANMIIDSVLRFRELGHNVSDMLVLSPMKKGVIGTIELNNRLQEVLNPHDVDKVEVKHGNRIFRVGDKIMQLVNQEDKGIYNGDIGIITAINKEKIKKDNGKVVEVDTIYSDFQGIKATHQRNEWKELELGYSISIHKSQGGQAPIVIMPLSTSHYNMLARNLIYTGMTRAEKILVLIGQQRALNIAIANNKISQRNTKLKERIEALSIERKRQLL